MEEGGFYDYFCWKFGIRFKMYNELEYGIRAEKVDKSAKSAIVKESSSYFGCFCRGNKFRYGLKGNPV